MSSSGFMAINDNPLDLSTPIVDHVEDLLSHWTHQDVTTGSSPLTVCPEDLTNRRDQCLPTLSPATSIIAPKACEISHQPLDVSKSRPSLSKILAEAELIYGDEKPEFCINEPKDKMRTVKDTMTGELRDLWYRKWRGEAYGY